jgi:hypothetical protein
MVSLALTHGLLQPGRKQSADGGSFQGGENASFAEQIGVDFQRDVGFQGGNAFRVAEFYVLRV